MVKTAIFVEGQTELIFMREFLLRYFEYQGISLECYCLAAAGNLDTAPYDFPNVEAQFHFQIINVGNDEAVVTNLLKREKQMWKNGFQKIIGLRDMYSEAYRKVLKGERQIDPVVNAHFMESHKETILEKAEQPEKIAFSFAIMETEAWFLGLPKIFEKMNPKLASQYIQENLSFNLDEIDPETTFFHPASILEQILGLIGQTYKKKQGDIEAIVSSLEKEDFQQLLDSEKCNSFNTLFDAVHAHK